MNWIKENKFLTGFYAVLALGIGALGYLLYTAKAQYDTVSDSYTAEAAELHRLRTLPLFPNSENLAKIQDQKREHLAKIEDLQKSLISMQLPIAPMTPEQFQDKLRASVDAFTKQAADAGMQIPPKFFLGFDRYQSEPPKVAAAPLLGRELQAIELILSEMPSHGVTELKPMSRDELPEEGTGSAKPEPAKPGMSRSLAGGKNERPLLSTHAFEVTFVASRETPQFMLNSITGNQKQFLIPRLVVIKNLVDKGPSRVDPNAAVPPPTPATPAPSRPPTQAVPGVNPTGVDPAAPAGDAAPPLIIVGDEKVETTLRVEIVDFAEITPKQPVAAQ